MTERHLTPVPNADPLEPPIQIAIGYIEPEQCPCGDQAPVAVGVHVFDARLCINCSEQVLKPGWSALVDAFETLDAALFDATQADGDFDAMATAATEMLPLVLANARKRTSG